MVEAQVDALVVMVLNKNSQTLVNTMFKLKLITLDLVATLADKVAKKEAETLSDTLVIVMNEAIADGNRFLS